MISLSALKQQDLSSNVSFGFMVWFLLSGTFNKSFFFSLTRDFILFLSGCFSRYLYIIICTCFVFSYIYHSSSIWTKVRTCRFTLVIYVTRLHQLIRLRLHYPSIKTPFVLNEICNIRRDEISNSWLLVHLLVQSIYSLNLYLLKD